MHEVSVDLLNQEMQRLFKECINLLSESVLCIDDEDYDLKDLGVESFVEYASEKIELCDNACGALEKSRVNGLNNEELFFESFLISDSLIPVLCSIIPVFKIKVNSLSESIEELNDEIEELNNDIEAIPPGFEKLKEELDTALVEMLLKVDSVIDVNYRNYLSNFDSMLRGVKKDTDGLREFSSISNRDKIFERIEFDPNGLDIIVYDKDEVDAVFIIIKNIFERIYDALRVHFFTKLTEEVSTYNEEFTSCLESFSNKIIRTDYTSDFCLDDLETIYCEYNEIMPLILSDLENIFNGLKSSSLACLVTTFSVRVGIVAGLLGMTRKDNLENAKLSEDISVFGEYFIINIEALRDEFSYSVINTLNSIRLKMKEESLQQVNSFISTTLEVLQTEFDGLNGEALECLEKNESIWVAINNLKLLEKNICLFVKDFKCLESDIYKLQEVSGVAQ